MSNLNGNAAVVTGVASGTGKDIALERAQAGAAPTGRPFIVSRGCTQ